MKPIILCIETSSTVCSVAICQGENILASKESQEGLAIQHLTLFIQEVCLRSGIPLQSIDAVACSQGPGSFSALRTGLATSKSICLSLHKPLILLSSLRTLAWLGRQHNESHKRYVASIGARNDEIYLAIYNSALKEVLSPRVEIVSPKLIVKEPIFLSQSLITGVNTQIWKELIPLLEHELLEVQYSAQNMVHLALEAYRDADFSDLDQSVPLYIKDPHITTPKVKIHN